MSDIQFITPHQPHVIKAIQGLYGDFNIHSISGLERIYEENVVFHDPFCSIHGIEALKSYFEATLKNIAFCRFEFDESLSTSSDAFLKWQMTYSHKSLKKGRTLRIDGATHIKFNKHIYYQKDFYDAGALLYEHIPLLGSAVQAVKRRVHRSS